MAIFVQCLFHLGFFLYVRKQYSTVRNLGMNYKCTCFFAQKGQYIDEYPQNVAKEDWSKFLNSNFGGGGGGGEGNIKKIAARPPFAFRFESRECYFAFWAERERGEWFVVVEGRCVRTYSFLYVLCYPLEWGGVILGLLNGEGRHTLPDSLLYAIFSEKHLISYYF